MVKWTRHDLARAAWLTAGTATAEAALLSAAFEHWWSTRIRVSTGACWGCPPLILAVAAWNGARGRDSLAAMPPDDGAAFEQWYYGLAIELTDGDETAQLVN